MSFDRSAVLIAKGKRFPDQSVYGDEAAPKRRDIYLDSSVRRKLGRLPQSVKVRWMGEIYKADLSFRTGKHGRRVPVYEFYVESRL